MRFSALSGIECDSQGRVRLWRDAAGGDAGQDNPEQRPRVVEVPMTIAQAAAILNYHRHRDCDQWEVERRYDGSPPLYVNGCDRYDALTIFEAIAIAERYRKLNP